MRAQISYLLKQVDWQLGEQAGHLKPKDWGIKQRGTWDHEQFNFVVSVREEACNRKSGFPAILRELESLKVEDPCIELIYSIATTRN